MDPIQGQPTLPGWYWVSQQGQGIPLICKVEWNSPEGPATLIPQLHVLGFIPSVPSPSVTPDVWFGPLVPPEWPPSDYLSSGEATS